MYFKSYNLQAQSETMIMLLDKNVLMHIEYQDQWKLIF